jgi:hypothetical protein
MAIGAEIAIGAPVPDEWREPVASRPGKCLIRRALAVHSGISRCAAAAAATPCASPVQRKPKS